MALSVAELANAGKMEEGLLHPELVVPSVPGVAPAPGFSGMDGIRRYFREAAAHNFLAQAALRAAHVTEAGNVFASGSLICTVSGHTEEFPAWFVYRFRDQLVSAIETYIDEDAAREAAAR